MGLNDNDEQIHQSMCVLTMQDDGFFGASLKPNLHGLSIGLNSPASLPEINALALVI